MTVSLLLAIKDGGRPPLALRRFPSATILFSFQSKGWGRVTERKGHVWTANKLEFLSQYLPAFQKACKRFWNPATGQTNTYYVDGFAGPGENEIDGVIHDGSPLIALRTTPPFTRYFLTEQKRGNVRALEAHLTSAPDLQPFQDRIELRHGDFNVEVDAILRQLRPGMPTFFFLDPEGLELDWETVRKIGQRQKADLFILISGSGVVRCAGSPGKPAEQAAIDRVTRFYGHDRWLPAVQDTNLSTVTGRKKFEAAVDLYLDGLRGLGFTHVEQFLVATNSRGSSLHALVFAAKNDTAIKIAGQVLAKIQKNRRGQTGLFSNTGES